MLKKIIISRPNASLNVLYFINCKLFNISNSFYLSLIQGGGLDQNISTKYIGMQDIYRGQRAGIRQSQVEMGGCVKPVLGLCDDDDKQNG